MQQQQQHADYDLLAVFPDEAQAYAAAEKLHKAGFSEDEVHQLPVGALGSGQFREHGPDRSRSEFFLQTQRSKPNPLVVILSTLIFAIVLGGISFGVSLALPRILTEPITTLICVVIGIILGFILGTTRSGRVRGAIGQDLTKTSSSASKPIDGALTLVALRFPGQENISRRSRARAILINNGGKIDRSVGRKE